MKFASGKLAWPLHIDFRNCKLLKLKPRTDDLRNVFEKNLELTRHSILEYSSNHLYVTIPLICPNPFNLYLCYSIQSKLQISLDPYSKGCTSDLIVCPTSSSIPLSFVILYNLLLSSDKDSDSSVKVILESFQIKSFLDHYMRIFL